MSETVKEQVKKLRCRLGLHKWKRGVTGYVDRCEYCPAKKVRIDDYHPY